MKIAVIGGGGVRGPASVYALAGRWVDLPIDELALYDIDSERQDLMALVTARVLEGSEPRG